MPGFFFVVVLYVVYLHLVPLEKFLLDCSAEGKIEGLASPLQCVNRPEFAFCRLSTYHIPETSQQSASGMDTRPVWI